MYLISLRFNFLYKGIILGDSNRIALIRLLEWSMQSFNTVQSKRCLINSNKHALGWCYKADEELWVAEPGWDAPPSGWGLWPVRGGCWADPKDSQEGLLRVFHLFGRVCSLIFKECSESNTTLSSDIRVLMSDFGRSSGSLMYYCPKLLLWVHGLVVSCFLPTHLTWWLQMASGFHICGL